VAANDSSSAIASVPSTSASRLGRQQRRPSTCQCHQPSRQLSHLHSSPVYRFNYYLDYIIMGEQPMLVLSLWAQACALPQQGASGACSASKLGPAATRECMLTTLTDLKFQGLHATKAVSGTAGGALAQKEPQGHLGCWADSQEWLANKPRWVQACAGSPAKQEDTAIPRQV